MSAFLDTSLVLAFLHAGDANHGDATKILEAGLDGRWGTLLTSDWVYDETVTFALRRFGPRAVQHADELLLGEGIHMLRVTPEDFDTARRLFLERLASRLSLTDWTIVVQCEQQGVDTILSFDRGFDGFWPRNAPPEGPD